MDPVFEDADMRVSYDSVRNMYAVQDKNSDRASQWEFACGNSPTNLCEIERHRLTMAAITMLFKGQSRKTVKGEGYEGYMTDTRKYASVGSSYGRIVKGEVETNEGKRDISFLIMQPTQDSQGNSFN